MKMMRKNSNHLLIEISNCVGGGNFALQHLKSPNPKYQDLNFP